MSLRRRVCARFALLAIVALAGSAGAGASTARVQWMRGATSSGTPARFDRVGVLRVGRASARNVLVLEPGTSAGSAYFVPFARWLVSEDPGWQVWSVERRENLLEDQSVLDRAKSGRASPQQVFDYYLGYLTDPSVSDHFQPLAATADDFAKRWGLRVAVDDLHAVIARAHRLGGEVVLGGHSLGGAVTTAYATWDFGGHPGADGLAGLVFDDGASFGAETARSARQALAGLDAPAQSPWLSFGGIPAPYAGVYETTGALAALVDPDGASLGQAFSGLPADLKPSVPVTNLAQYGYALNVGTSPASLIAAQGHLGRGLATTPSADGLYGWDSTGALSPIDRFATMFSGAGSQSVDGVEWYFPQRLTDDTAAIGNGIANPAQSVLGVHSTLGRRLPHTLRMLAIQTALGGSIHPDVLQQTQRLARQSGIPRSHLTLINRTKTYAHNDPAGAYPHNVFFSRLVAFLRRLSPPR